MYYPGVSLVPFRVKANEDDNNNKHNNSSLPEIQSKKLKKISSAVDNMSKKSNISNSNSNSYKGIQQNAEIGASFVSFNIANADLRNSAAALFHQNQVKVKEKSNGEEYKNQNIKESFESLTTEGKKAESIPDFGK